VTGPIKNEQGEISGAKLVLLIACGLSVAWLVRDLFSREPLSEWHAALLGVLLVVGLLNRVSARGRFRLRLGRDGAEVEASEHNRQN
jgi:hypothetical protein